LIQWKNNCEQGTTDKYPQGKHFTGRYRGFNGKHTQKSHKSFRSRYWLQLKNFNERGKSEGAALQANITL